MGLGSTAKKLQTVTDRAEQLYKQVQDLQRRIIGLEESVEDTHDTVESLEHRISEQQALLEVMAEEQGIDVESVFADAAIDDAEELSNADETGDGGEGDDAATGDGATEATDDGTSTTATGE